MTSPSLVRTLPHLARRFVGHLTARALTPAEQDEVNRLLEPAERGLFWALPAPDQRHGYDSARAVADLRSGDRSAIRAMLLHDVGKAHSNLGAVARSLATAADALRLPMPARWRRYRDHGALGAADLATAGSEELVVLFAEHHSGARPAGMDAALWEALSAADHA